MSLAYPGAGGQPLARRSAPAGPRDAIELRAAATPFTLPPADVTASACPRCGLVFLDYPPGREAHLIVFGHRPEPQE